MLLMLVPRAIRGAERTLLQAMYGDREVAFEHVDLDLPPLVENGNSVALTVSVNSPMSEDDHITAIDVLAGENPTPHLVRFVLTPGFGARHDRHPHSAGRLASGFWPWRAPPGTNCSAPSAEILVTEAACLDFLI